MQGQRYEDYKDAPIRACIQEDKGWKAKCSILEENQIKDPEFHAAFLLSSTTPDIKPIKNEGSHEIDISKSHQLWLLLLY